MDITATVIMSTTRTKGKKPSSAPFTWCVVVSLLLFMLAAHSFVARITMLSGDGVRETLFDGGNVSEEELGRLISSREAVVSWYATNAVLDDLALAYLEKARRVGVLKSGAAPDLKRALEYQKMALSHSPADTYGWSRLTYMLLVGQGPSEQAAQSFVHAMDAAPYEPRLMLNRLSTAMMLSSYLDEDAKSRLPRLVRDAWMIDEEGVAQAAKAGRFTSQLKSVLGEDYGTDNDQ